MSYQRFRQIWMGGRTSDSSPGSSSSSSTDPRWNDGSSIADRRMDVLADAVTVNQQVRSSSAARSRIDRRTCGAAFWSSIRRNGGQYTWDAHRILQEFGCWDINEPGKHKTAVMYMLLSEQLPDKDKKSCLIDYFRKPANMSLMVTRLPDHEEYGDDRGLTIMEIAARRRLYFFFETVGVVTGIKTPLTLFTEWTNVRYLPVIRETKLLDIAIERLDYPLIKQLLPESIVGGTYRDVRFNELNVYSTMKRCFDKMATAAYIEEWGYENWFHFATFVKGRIPAEYIMSVRSFAATLNERLRQFQFSQKEHQEVEDDSDTVTFMWTR